MIEYSLQNPTGNTEADIKLLVDVFPPIFNKFWDARGRDWYKVSEARIDAVLLAQMWAARVTRLFLAKDGAKVVGFLLGSSIPPFFHVDRVFQVEAVHGETPEIEKGLLEHLVKGFEFFPDRFLSLPDYCEASGLKLLGRRGLNLYERA